MRRRAPTSKEEIKEIVKTANEATKNLDADLRPKAFEIILNHLLASGSTPPPRMIPKKQGGAEKQRAKSGSPSTINPVPVDLKGGKGGKSLRDFFKEKAPGNHREKLTVFVYYLNKIAKVADVLPGHVLTCYNDVGERKPTAIRQLFVDTIAEKAWVERGEAEGSVRITVNGENLVEHDLPRK